MTAPHTSRLPVSNEFGWELDVKRHVDPARVDRSRRPIVMIPGYAMNTFILTYHPGGPSMVEYLVRDGFEVWTANLRGQGDSRKTGYSSRYGLRELCLEDLPRVFDHVLSESLTQATMVDAVGCSLGASILYGYLAHNRVGHLVGAAVSIGGPFRLVGIHPLMRALFASPSLVGLLPTRGTRRLAKLALPVLQRFPKILSLYLNVDLIDLEAVDEIIKTVDDPVPHINVQMVHWMRQKDMMVGGVNVTDALRGMELPLLCVLANADGIVPPEAVLSAREVLHPGGVDVLNVGNDTDWFAHADLFASRPAPDLVFEPLRQWLAGNYER